MLLLACLLKAQHAGPPPTGTVYLVFKKLPGILQMRVDGVRSSKIRRSSDMFRWDGLDHFEAGIWQAKVLDPKQRHGNGQDGH